MNEWCECGVLQHPFTPFLYHPDIWFYPNHSLPYRGNALLFLFSIILLTSGKSLFIPNILSCNSIPFSVSPKFLWEIVVWIGRVFIFQHLSLFSQSNYCCWPLKLTFFSTTCSPWTARYTVIRNMTERKPQRCPSQRCTLRLIVLLSCIA